MQQSKGRILWIDEFKGFVLLLVCLFHVEQSFKNIDFGMLHLSAMRMSAFFFISGVLFSTRRFKDFKSYALHKTEVLLLPYIWLSLLFLALDPVVWNFDWFPRAPKMQVLTIRPEIHTLKDYVGWNLAKIFVAGKSSIGSGPIWFVFTLYSISLMFFGVQKTSVILSNAKNPVLQKIIVAAVAASSLIAGWLLFKNHIRLPLGIERDLTCLAFFALGNLCKEPIQKLSKHSLLTFFLTIAALALYIYFEKPDPWFSIMNNDLGKDLPQFILSSIFGILALIGAFQLFSKLPDVNVLRIVKGILRNISRNALIILAVHWWALLVLRTVFKPQLDKPIIANLSILIVTAFSIGAIPLFRCKLYKVIGKEKTTVKESLSIK
ncbi:MULTISPECIES: acyltransferase [unclassified Fibrobacter]|uniref:acyltransferase family protein n=1 Tax=unclassified Fibrobacter TaxID=2634177 RepID=UPI00091AAA5C|nr:MULTISPECIES: acyltransferase [unclassified Fibrobacter]OWV04804.1 acyltransferase [Fibrobacter sp. UWH3]SHL18549.1 Acyltransferase family protein [Fibrobacter sp. UWH6]